MDVKPTLVSLGKIATPVGFIVGFISDLITPLKTPYGFYFGILILFIFIISIPLSQISLTNNFFKKKLNEYWYLPTSLTLLFTAILIFGLHYITKTYDTTGQGIFGSSSDDIKKLQISFGLIGDNVISINNTTKDIKKDTGRIADSMDILTNHGASKEAIEKLKKLGYNWLDGKHGFGTALILGNLEAIKIYLEEGIRIPENELLSIDLFFRQIYLDIIFYNHKNPGDVFDLLEKYQDSIIDFNKSYEAKLGISSIRFASTNPKLQRLHFNILIWSELSVEKKLNKEFDNQLKDFISLKMLENEYNPRGRHKVSPKNVSINMTPIFAAIVSNNTMAIRYLKTKNIEKKGGYITYNTKRQNTVWVQLREKDNHGQYGKTYILQNSSILKENILIDLSEYFENLNDKSFKDWTWQNFTILRF